MLLFYLLVPNLGFGYIVFDDLHSTHLPVSDY